MPTNPLPTLLVILGAGASNGALFGSPRSREWQPPLTKTMFAVQEERRAILREYRRANSVFAELRSVGDSGFSVESALRQIRDDGTPGRKSQMVAVRFYLRDVLALAPVWADANGGAECYDVLVGRLHTWQTQTRVRVLLISFNYDTLLETSRFDQVGVGFARFRDYLDGPLALVKPHGSFNWWTHVLKGSTNWNDDEVRDPERAKHELIRTADHWTEIPREPMEIRDSNDPRRQVPGELMVPSLALPVDDKSTLVLPEGHEAALVDGIKSACCVLTIGWQASEVTFLERMKPPSLPAAAPIFTAARSDDTLARIGQRFKAAQIPNQVRPLALSFSDLVRGEQLGKVLEAAALASRGKIPP